jgi:uncharacterized protein
MKTKSLTFLLSLTFLFLFSGSSIALPAVDWQEEVRRNRLSADQGHAEGQYNLGLRYKWGQGVSQDYKEAFRLLSLAAEQGYEYAQFHLGEMYFHGRGILQDYALAYMWWNICSSSGTHDGCVRNKKKVEKKMTESQIKKAQEPVKWFRLSEHGYAYAQYHLGWIYYQGNKVHKDYVLAHMWWNICGSSETQGCVESRNMVEEKMSESQIEKAQEMARNWKPKEESKGIFEQFKEKFGINWEPKEKQKTIREMRRDIWQEK